MKSKDVHIAVKRDDGVSYLMRRFNFSRADELFEAIRKVTPSNAEDLIRKLEKKQRLTVKKDKLSIDSRNSEEKLTEHDLVQPAQEDVLIEDAQGSVVDCIEEEKHEVTEHLDIEQLKLQEQELSAEVCRLEGNHKDLVVKRRGLVAELEKAQKALVELRRILKEQESNVTTIYEQYNDCAKEMDKINQKRNACKSSLEAVREQILLLQKVVVLVYTNGNIEVENAEMPTVTAEEITATLSSLICIPEAGELTINELKVVAKLQQMVKVYQSSGCVYEIIFDSSKVESFWTAIVS